MSHKLKNIKLCIPVLAAILSSNAQAVLDNNHAVLLSQPVGLINSQISNFDNYLNNILKSSLSFYESSSIKSRFITSDNKYIIIMEVPGFDKNQIKVKVSSNKLFVKGEIGEKNKVDDNYMNKNFNYVISLYEDVDQKNISSNLKNGILTITLPRIKIKEQEAREISIN